MSIARGAGVAVLVCVLAASCGGATSSAARAHSAPSTTRPPDAESRLASQLLSRDDLGAGWSVDRRGSVPGADPCGLSLSAGPGAPLETRALFEASARGIPALGEVLVSFPTATAARNYFVENANSGGCVSVSAAPLRSSSEPVASQSNSTVVYSFLTATDEGQAFQDTETTATSDGKSVTVGIDRLLARRGRIVTLLFLAESRDPAADWNLFVDLAAKAVERITDAETSAPYALASRLCGNGLSRTPDAKAVTYAGVTTYGALLGSPLVGDIPDEPSTRAFLAACSYAGPEQRIIRVYMSAAGQRFEVTRSSL